MTTVEFYNDPGRPKKAMTDTTQQERELFEAWFTKDGNYEPEWLDGRMVSGGFLYSSADTENMWQAWQAARATPQGADPMNYKGMFLAAVSALAEIDALLGVPEDGCNDPQVTVSTLADYVAGVAEMVKARDQWVDSQYSSHSDGAEPVAPADAYKGQHIHGVWAREIDAILALRPPEPKPSELQADALDAARYRWIQAKGTISPEDMNAAIDAELARQEGSAT